MANGADAQKRIDAVLRHAVEAGEVPGVVAMAATLDGPIYEGGFGMRALGAGPAMTLDTVFRIASMTKAITSVAAMQLVEQSKLRLDDPVPEIDPALNEPQVLEGFDAAGQPRLRPAKRPLTLRHLLTHTAGFTYDWSNPNTAGHVQATGMPLMSSGKRAALCQPLAFDPGEKWEYGINIDWVGRIIEEVSGQTIEAYLREHICGPLGMTDTGFVPTPRWARTRTGESTGRAQCREFRRGIPAGPTRRAACSSRHESAGWAVGPRRLRASGPHAPR